MQPSNVYKRAPSRWKYVCAISKLVEKAQKTVKKEHFKSSPLRPTRCRVNSSAGLARLASAASVPRPVAPLFLLHAHLRRFRHFSRHDHIACFTWSPFLFTFFFPIFPSKLSYLLLRWWLLLTGSLKVTPLLSDCSRTLSLQEYSGYLTFPCPSQLALALCKGVSWPLSVLIAFHYSTIPKL